MSAEAEDWEYRDIMEREVFLEAVASGTPEILAGHEVSWSPRKTREICADKDFAELISYAKIRRDDKIERVLYDVASKGNMNAIAMILLNRRASEFRDIKRIEIKQEGTVTVEMVHSAKVSLLELMREGGAEQFQIGGALDKAIEARSHDDSD